MASSATHQRVACTARPTSHCVKLYQPTRTPCVSRRLPVLQTRATSHQEPGSTSLIPETLKRLEEDTELQQHLARLQSVGQAGITREEKLRRQRSLDSLGLPSFQAKCKESGSTPLVRGPTKVLQINIGLYCNQACTHCHVESSPRRREAMDLATVDACLRLLRGSPGVGCLDVTGGAPELHQHFRYLVKEARALGIEVIDRCNLTVLLEPGQEDLAHFLADNKVHVVASLPCYSEKNVDQQRGVSVFGRSTQGLQRLNALGYGLPGSGLVLDLVYNPGGAFLAPQQAKLEAAYKQQLWESHGVVFNHLFCLNNMPLKRFADFLIRRGQLDEYMQLLVSSFNPAAAASLMCRDTVSVRWDGRLYDCDFNQQQDLRLMAPEGLGGPATTAGRGKQPLSVHDLASLQQLEGLAIAVDSHCYGCTAGSGSSCQGALSS